MTTTLDKIICRELAFECALGFHDYELGVRQKILVDLEVEVMAPSQKQRDAVESIRFDYYKVNALLGDFFKKGRFNLLETVADEMARLLLKNFQIEAVTVMVTKFPLDMPNARSVSYVCRREK